MHRRSRNNLPCPFVSAKELNASHDKADASDDRQNDKPEPEENVNLLVENVHSQDAKGVKALDCTRPSVFVKDTLFG